MTLCVWANGFVEMKEEHGIARSLFNHLSSYLSEKIKTITDAIKFK